MVKINFFSPDCHKKYEETEHFFMEVESEQSEGSVRIDVRGESIKICGGINLKVYHHSCNSLDVYHHIKDVPDYMWVKSAHEISSENRELQAENETLREALDHIKVRAIEIGSKELHDYALEALKAGE